MTKTKTKPADAGLVQRFMDHFRRSRREVEVSDLELYWHSAEAVANGRRPNVEPDALAEACERLELTAEDFDQHVALIREQAELQAAIAKRDEQQAELKKVLRARNEAVELERTETARLAEATKAAHHACDVAQSRVRELDTKQQRLVMVTRELAAAGHGGAGDAEHRRQGDARAEHLEGKAREFDARAGDRQLDPRQQAAHRREADKLRAAAAAARGDVLAVTGEDDHDLDELDELETTEEELQ